MQCSMSSCCRTRVLTASLAQVLRRQAPPWKKNASSNFGISQTWTNRILSCRPSSSFSNSNDDDTSSLFGSFGAAAAKSATQSIKDRIKSTILNEALRDDSRLWQSSSTNRKRDTYQNTQNPNQHTNGLNGHGHGHYGHVNGTSISNIPGQPLLEEHAIGSVNESTLTSIQTDRTTTTNSYSLDDPLDDLYIHNASSRYWPNLPSPVQRRMEETTINGESDNSTDPFVLTQMELGNLSQSIREDLIGTDHPVLNRAAAYFFEAAADGGKKVRPMMVLLLSRALADAVSNTSLSSSSSTLFTPPMSWQRVDLPEAQRRLAEISEMIHTASLFHDDVIDGADTRRGVPSVHAVFGNKMAILAGDYLLARASICLARLRNAQVVETMSTIIEHLVRGEVMQIKGSSSPSTATTTNSSTANDQSTERIVYYLRKNFYKTGSLMANSCRSTALLGDYPPELVAASYKFGKHVGMAFQLVDDCLDFEGSLASLGKPALSDLKAGLATAPVLFAAQEQQQQQAENSNNNNLLWTLVDRKFKQPGDVELALEMVLASPTAMQQTKELARFHAECAMDALLQAMPSSSSSKNSLYRDALIRLAHKVVARTK
ncbi:hypothetical protein ACA910_018047 [Epithemia clementina (nom. ined.)]